MHHNRKQIGNGNLIGRLPNAKPIGKEKDIRAYKVDDLTWHFLPPAGDAGVATPIRKLPVGVRLDKHGNPVGGRRTRRRKSTKKRKNKKGYKTRKGKK